MTRNLDSLAPSFSRTLGRAALLALAVGFLFDVLTVVLTLSSFHPTQLDWVLGGGFWIWQKVLRQGAHSAGGIIAITGINWIVYSLAAFLFGLGAIVISRVGSDLHP